MNDFIHVANRSDLSDGGKLLVEADEQLVILFQVGPDFYCIDDVCTHDGGTLSDGPLNGCEIQCPRHGARFDIRNGKALSMPATEATHSHEVKVDGDRIFVRINPS